MARDQWLKGSTADPGIPAKGKKGKAKRDAYPALQQQRTTKASTADKHDCYHQAVQAPKQEITTLIHFYRQLNASRRQFQKPVTGSEEPVVDEDDFLSMQRCREPLVLREDFCGTAILCREWVSRGSLKTAVGVDIDEAVVRCGREKFMDGCDRVQLVMADVLKVDRIAAEIPKCDILCALNYGIFYFRQRSQLVRYFKKCREALDDGGILVCDMFGGAQCYQFGKKTVREYADFTYYFEQSSFDILTNTAKCHLHFRFDDGSWLKNAFNYDFRVYTIPEVREAMKDAGFKQTAVWWTETKGHVQEADDENSETEELDENDGVYIYERLDDTKPLQGVHAWNAYVVATDFE